MESFINYFLFNELIIFRVNFNILINMGLLDDPKNKTGYWGNHSATIDWCESNYEMNYYFAEFWNSISSLIMVILPIIGIIWYFKYLKLYDIESVKLGNSNLKQKLTMSISIVWCYLGLMLVGIGSIMFHMSLLYEYQLLDEIPMIFASGFLIYANYSILLSVPNPMLENSMIYKVLSQKWIVCIIITIYCSIVTYIYVFIYQNPVFHQVCYGVMVFVIVTENILVMNKLNMPSRIYLLQIFYYAFGFFLWNIDNKFCDYLISYRNTLNIFFDMENTKSLFVYLLVILLSALSELHAFWHLFTGYSAYMSILSLKYAHYYNCKNIEELKKENKFGSKLNPLATTCYDLCYYLREIDDFDKVKLT